MFLQNILPNHNEERSTYDLRNANDLANMFARTELFAKSFYPSTIRAWNDLPESTKNENSLSTFKRLLNSATNKPPPYYYYGDRNRQILHTQLILECSSLNDHLFKKSITDNPNCSCGARETSDHFLLKCVNYDLQRLRYLNDLPCRISTKTLLYGSSELSYEQNCTIFDKVHSYIIATKRFM